MVGDKQLSESDWLSLQTIIGDIAQKTEDADREYWHYTSTKGILGIFNSYETKRLCPGEQKVSECSIYASSIRFMNDAKEYEDGNVLFDKFCRELGNTSQKQKAFEVCGSEKRDNIYLISFCGYGDLLSQWKWYGKDSGVSLCFDLNNIEYSVYDYFKNEAKEPNTLYDSCTKPVSVRYDEIRKKDLFNYLVNHRIIEKSEAYYLVKPAFVPFCKDEGFSEEKESRLVFYYANLKKRGEFVPKFDFVYNTGEQGRIKPALNVKFRLKKSLPKPANLLSKMIVGPGINQESVFNFLIHFFDYEHFTFFTSKDTDGKVIDLEEFVSMENDYRVHRVKFPEIVKEAGVKKDVVREAYRCENGIIIEKSSIPFRG